MDVGTLAQHLGLRPNGVRRHLELLLRTELISSVSATTNSPGRPRLLYDVKPPAPPERVGYPLLADMLAGAVGNSDNADVAEQEGRHWGRILVNRPIPSASADEDDAAGHLIAMLDRLGFAPEAEPTQSGVRLDLRRCPFLETAKAHPGVVCSLHLGLMRGALAELGAALDTERLDPLVQPDLCVAHLRRSA